MESGIGAHPGPSHQLEPHNLLHSGITDHSAATIPQTTCPHGCPNKSFKRPYERNRHIKEQHRCSHQECEGIEFSSPESQRDHMEKQHGEDGFPYKCGSCTLRGGPRKSFRRSEKLKRHFEDVHYRVAWSNHPCTKRPCYVGGIFCGGTYFLSGDEVKKHLELDHTVTPSENGWTVQQENGKYIS
jgi:hypothetical protein